ncbi:MAG: polysaccharide deacetylase family protein [Betaproteobacteria bacterium]
MGKKEILANLLRETGLLAIMRRVPRPAKDHDHLRILAYHRICDVPDESTFPFDPELISASTSDFREQMRHVAAHFVPVSCADVMAALDGTQALPKRAVVVTFDDGHLDNYTQAFPVLKALGIPATIFLSTAYVGEPGTFWFDQVANILFRAPASSHTLPGSEQPVALGNTESRRDALKNVLRYLKKIPDARRREVIAELAATLTPATTNNDSSLSGVVTWPQVREMASARIEFGSHGVSHPVLTQLEDSVLERELVESRAVLEAQLGRPVETIAYPDGGLQAFDARVVEAVKRAGYRLGLSYISGTNHLHHMDRFALHRLHVERYTSRAWFEAMLELPRLFK